MKPQEALDRAIMGEAIASDHVEKCAKLWQAFGQSIRSARRKKRIARNVFARMMDYTPAMLSLLESGDRRWPRDKAKLAVKLLQDEKKATPVVS